MSEKKTYFVSVSVEAASHESALDAFLSMERPDTVRITKAWIEGAQEYVFNKDQTDQKYTRMPTMSWDTCEVTENRVQDLMENDGMTEDEARRDVESDHDLLTFEWDNLCECLTEEMNRLSPTGMWTATVTGFGWMNQDGAYRGGEAFHADNGEDLLRCILPDTDCTFWIYVDDDMIRINNCHHDSPIRGKEWYEIVPWHEPEEDEEEEDE